MEYIKSLVKNYRYRSFLLVLAVTICNILALFYSYSFKFVIDAIEQKSVENAWKYFLVVLILQTLATVLNVLIYDYYLRVFQKDVERDTRNNLMSEILTWPYSKSKDITPGNFSTLMTNDVTKIGQYVSLYDFMIISNTIRFIITYFLLFSLDKVIGFVVLLSVPLYYILTTFTMKPMQKFVKEGYIARDQLNNSFLDILNNLISIKSYNIEETSKKHIKNNTIELYYKEKKLQKWKAIFSFIKDFLSSFMPVVILGLSIVRIINDKMTLGTFVAVYGFLGAIYLPISEIFHFKAMKNNLEPVINRITPIIDNKINKDDKRKLNYGYPKIIIKNLNYFHEEKKIIHNFSAKMEGCGLYRISGDNGKGKSTLFNIISGLYNDFDGEVFINVEKESAFIAYMNQRDILFDGNIYDNITLFNRNKINKVYFEIIEKIKNRSGDSDSFSGGEKRLFLFWRTISSNASIFLFDEPFEGVDEGTRSYMQKIIIDLSKNNLVIIINHEDKDFKDMVYENIKL